VDVGASHYKYKVRLHCSFKVNGQFSPTDDAEDPACNPIFWISKWVDYSDKYGLGYQLCDGSVGVLFNDSSRLLLKEDGE
jgi:hypothetical protein